MAAVVARVVLNALFAPSANDEALPLIHVAILDAEPDNTLKL